MTGSTQLCVGERRGGSQVDGRRGPGWQLREMTHSVHVRGSRRGREQRFVCSRVFNFALKSFTSCRGPWPGFKRNLLPEQRNRPRRQQGRMAHFL